MATAVQSTSASSSTSTTLGTTSGNTLDPQQFMNIMLTELEQQDPLNPTSSSDLVNQMSQIQSIQSNMSLTSTLQDLALSQKFGSAGNLLGKQVSGQDSNGNNVAGIASSVIRDGNTVYLQLDSGSQLPVDNVLGVSNLTAATSSVAKTTNL